MDAALSTQTLWLMGWGASSFIMGMTGGIHCAAMCGALCHFAQPGAQPHVILGARLVSYTALGAVAASLFAWVAQAGLWAQSLQPFMQLALVAVLVHGLVLAATGRPLLARSATVGSARVVMVGPRTARSRMWKASALGAGLALLPCGLFYTALSTAALGGTALSGGLSMAAFALGSSVWLWAGIALNAGRAPGEPSRWLEQWQRHGPRVAGALAVLLASVALWHARQGRLVCA